MRAHRNGTEMRTRALLAVVMLILAPPAFAQEASPPLPPPRPDRHAPSPVVSPVEPAKPTDAPKLSDAPKPSDAPKAEEKPQASEADQGCLDRLKALGVQFETRPETREESCLVQNAVLVSGLADNVAVSPASLMRCPMAESLAVWAKDVLKVEADRHFQTSVRKILIGTSYQCRNQRSGEKLSEHAFGNGVDIMGFTFEKHPPLTIGSQTEGSPEQIFESAVHKGACPVFTTVLGPGADADHGNHLHLDMRARKANYRICQ
jgi:hypothetical protein